MENEISCDGCSGISKASSTFQKYINNIRRKWSKDQEKVKLLKLEVIQLHHLCDKLLADGRLTIDELRGNVMSRKEAKKKLLKK